MQLGCENRMFFVVCNCVARSLSYFCTQESTIKKRICHTIIITKTSAVITSTIIIMSIIMSIIMNIITSTIIIMKRAADSCG